LSPFSTSINTHKPSTTIIDYNFERNARLTPNSPHPFTYTLTWYYHIIFFFSFLFLFFFVFLFENNDPNAHSLSLSPPKRELCESKLPWSNVQILDSLRLLINFHTPLKALYSTPSTSSMACVLPITDIFGPLVLKLNLSPRNWTLFEVRYRPCHCRTKPSLSLSLTKAIYTQDLLVSGPSKFAKPREKTEPDSDPFRS